MNANNKNNNNNKNRNKYFHDHDNDNNMTNAQNNKLPLTAIVPTALWRAVKKYGPTRRRVQEKRS